MHIYPKNTGPVRPETNRISQTDDQLDRGTIKPVAPAPSTADRSDKVEISDAGRALSARTDDTQATGVDPARSSRIRSRILSGAYDTLEVVDTVAKRLLDSGDL
jgi:negative regulator of flagellin synthesis FlgM